MDSVVIHPFMGVSGEYSVILAGERGELRNVDVVAQDEFSAVRQAIEETKWNIKGLITVDTLETIKDDLDPVLQFEFEPI
jgi:hypothetical protein